MSAFCCLKPSSQTDGNLVNQPKSKRQKDTRKSENDLLTQQRNTVDSPLLGSSMGLSFSELENSTILNPSTQIKQVL